jgi:hypothetical protein
VDISRHIASGHKGAIPAGEIRDFCPFGNRRVTGEVCFRRARFTCKMPWAYLPMQNVLKIRLRMSSVVVAPVISSSGRSAL